MKNINRKAISFILAIAMMISLIPSNLFVFAADETTTDTTSYGEVTAALLPDSSNGILVYEKASIDVEPKYVSSDAWPERVKLVDYYEEIYEPEEGGLEYYTVYKVESLDGYTPWPENTPVWVEANYIDIDSIEQETIPEDLELIGKQAYLKEPAIYENDLQDSQIFYDAPDLRYEWDAFLEDYEYNVVYEVIDVFKTSWGEWYQLTTNDAEASEWFDNYWLLSKDVEVITRNTPLRGYVNVSKNGELITEYIHSQREKAYITVAPGDQVGTPISYQWQIMIDGTSHKWANIYGYNSESAAISYALLCNYLNDRHVARIRCVVDDGTARYASSPVNVLIAYEIPTQAKAEPLSPKNNILAMDTVALDESIFQLKIAFVFKSEYREGEALPPVIQSLGPTTAFTYSSKLTQIPGYSIYIPLLNENGDFVDEKNNLITDPIYVAYDVNSNFTLKVTGLNANKVYEIQYRPNTNTSYTVMHYLQNPNNDEYELKETETLYGTTDSLVPENLANEGESGYEGFRYIAYKRQVISGDGGTVIEIKYDREYYTIDFILGEGGYGVEPVSLRYGATTSFGTPTRSGYTFTGWTLTSAIDKNDIAVSDETLTSMNTAYDINDEKAITVPMYHLTYTASWNASVAKITYVYWKENADDNGFTYWGYMEDTAAVGSTISASDNVPTSVTTVIGDPSATEDDIDEKPYFTYCDEMSDHNVVVKGDGTTAINVYYLRNTYYLVFRAPGNCTLQPHRHDDSCQAKCTLTQHVHDNTCIRTQICELEEHKAHTSSCRICGYQNEHVHVEDCYCDQVSHPNHTNTCYKYAGDIADNVRGNPPSSPKEGQVYVYRGILRTYRYIYINNKWYTYNDTSLTSSPSNPVSPTCGLTINNHIHSDECATCGKTVHSHTEACYTDSIHVHTQDCYSYSCDATAHYHTGDCFRGCTQLEHDHGDDENGNNIVKVVAAKYDALVIQYFQNGVTDDNNVTYSKNARWFSSATSNYYSILQKMPAGDSKNQTPYITLTYEAPSNGSIYTWYYAMEALPNVDYGDKTIVEDKNIKYYLDFSGSTSARGSLDLTYKEEYFPITGFRQRDNDVPKFTNYIAYLYYTRNSYTLSFNDSTGVISSKTQSVKYQADISGAYFVPTDLPNGKEEGSVKFVGWYTTPACADGTEFVFDGATMPSHDVMLYAKWEPCYYTAKVYANANDVNNGNAPISTQTVEFGKKATAPDYSQYSNGFDFVGWFYQDTSGEHSFVFATMPIKKNMTIYAKWESRVYVDYDVSYIYKNTDGTEIEIAEKTTGEELAGTTDTFQPKVNNELFEGYREGYFPTVTSQSVQLQVDESQNHIRFEYLHSGTEVYAVRHYIYNESTKVYDLVATSNPISTSFAQVTATMESYIPDDKKALFADLTPDAYQKELTITATGNTTQVNDANYINFYWSKNGMFVYQIEYKTQNLDGGYTIQYQSYESDVNGKHLSFNLPTYDGFGVPTVTFSPNTVSATTVPTTDNYLLEVTLTTNMLIEVKYDRLSVDYSTHYIHRKPIKDTNGNITSYENINVAASTIATATFGSTVTVTASATPDEGYVLSGANSQTLYISSIADNNTVTFYYEETQIPITYVLYAKDGTHFATYTEYVSAVTGAPQGYDSNNAAGTAGYKFLGWYSDQALQHQIATSSNLTPSKVSVTGHDNRTYLCFKSITYYGLFELGVSSLTIKVDGIIPETDQGFIYTIKGTGTNSSSVNLSVSVIGKGSVTITNLPIDSYTVTWEKAWSWRYNVQEQTALNTIGITLTTTAADNVVTFTYSAPNDKWLSDNAVNP